MQILSWKFYKMIFSTLIYLKYPVNSVFSDIIKLIVPYPGRKLKDPVKIVHIINVYVLLIIMF